MIIDKYTLTYRHTIMTDNGNVIEAEEPHTMEIRNCNMDNHHLVGYRSHILNELFYRLLSELKEQI